MLEVKVISSGSKGNCYVLDNGSSQIMLDAGVSLKDMQRELKHDFSRLVGCLVTHGHGDHCKGVKDLVGRGVNVYTSVGTAEEMGIYSRRIKPIKRAEGEEFYELVRLGDWEIIAFESQHDTKEPINFLLRDNKGNKVLFVTDSYYIKYRFTGITHFLVECNYDSETLRTSSYQSFLKKRVFQSHMGLDTLVDFFKTTDLSRCQQIFLLHLSSNNADRYEIYNKVAAVTGSEIYIA